MRVMRKPYKTPTFDNIDATTAFIPWSALYWAMWPRTDQEYQLKVATLFYERVIFPITKWDLNGIIQVFSLGEGTDEKTMRSAWISANEAFPSMDYLQAKTAIQPILGPRQFGQLCCNHRGNYRKGLVGPVDRTIMQTHKVGRNRVREMKKDRYGYTREANAIASAAFGSFLLWTRIRPLLPSCYLSFTPVELYAADALTRTSARGKSTLSLNPISALVPAASELTWPEVFELRRDKRIGAFRKWLRDRSSRFDKVASPEIDAVMTL